MNLFKKLYSHIIGHIYIPKDILQIQDPLILHISDTPYMLYSPLKKLLNQLKPTYIIHTGDLVDNIKLEFYPSKIDLYTMQLSKLIHILANSNAKKVYISLGNHDNKKVLKELYKNCIIVDDISNINIEGLSLNISHFPNKIALNPTTFNLFGHNLDILTHTSNNNIFLNGIEGIHLINIRTKEIYSLSYPYGTDDVRMKKNKIGF